MVRAGLQATLLAGLVALAGACAGSGPITQTGYDQICQTPVESARVRIFRRGTKWGIDYADPAGRRVRSLVGTKAEAQAALARVQVALLEGQYGRLAPRRRATLQDVWALLERERAGARRSWASTATHIVRLSRLLGASLPVASLTRDRVAELRRQLAAEGLEPATRNRHVATLRAAVRLAVDHELIPAAPFGRLAMEREPPPPDRVLLEEEEQALLRAAHPRDRVVVIWALETGARRGELAAAVWSDLDLEAGEWRIPRTKAGRPRTVPLTPRAVEALRAWQAEPVAVLHRDRKRVRVEGPLVLGGVTASALSTAFEGLVERAGIAPIRLHDLRHTCATRMRRRGVHPVTIAAMLGHTSWQMVQRYQHVTLDDLRTATES